MKEVDADAIQVGVELRESVEPGFDSAPVVIARPIIADSLHVLERSPLRRIRNGLQLGPAGGAQAPFQILEIRVADVKLEQPDFIAHRFPSLPLSEFSATLEPTSLHTFVVVDEAVSAGGQHTAHSA